MPSGAAVIRREGVRGVVWSVKFCDSTGRQVKERLGREDEGWSRQKAERALGARLQDVERNRWRKPTRETFATFAERFETDYLPTRNLKPSTLIDYRLTLRLHLRPWFGERELAAVEPREVDAYIAAKTGTLSPKTIGNHLGLLSVMFKVAKRWRLITVDPTEAVDRPRVETGEMNVLSEAEIARLLAAYRELEDAADEEQRPWWALARRIVNVALGTALRRGELLALRWRDVDLVESRLHVREAFVRGAFQTPKSKASRRTIDLGSRMLAAFEEQLGASSYQGEDELVFGHPELGTPLDPSKLSRDYLRPALKRANVTKPFRPWHDMRHTALTHEAAAGNPAVYVQMRAGHSQGSITERYVHAAQVLFPGAAERGERRIFGGLTSAP